MKKIAIPLILGFLLHGGSLLACDLCAAYRSMDARETKPGFNVGVAEQFTHFGTMQQDGRKVDDPAGQSLESSITQIVFGYRFDRDFGLQLNVPYISRSFRRPTEAGTIEHGNESGLGDISLLGHYRAFSRLTQDTTLALDILGGIKMPTGSSRRISEELTEMDAAPPSGIHGHDLALGSGSWDGIVGGSFFTRWERLFATGGIMYTIRSRGDFDYRFANDLSWNVKPGAYLWLTDRGTLGLQLAVSGEDKGKDDLAGVSAEDTGMTSVFIGPEVSFTWKEHLSAELGAEFPVVSNNTALQLVPDYRVKTALTWRF